jgi:hypothetical protein
VNELRLRVEDCDLGPFAGTTRQTRRREHARIAATEYNNPLRHLHRLLVPK